MDFLLALGSLFKGWRVTTWISTPLRLLVLLPLGTAESYPIKIAGRSLSFLEGNKRAPKSKGETILNGLPSFMDFSSVMARIIRQSSAIPTLVNVRGPWCTPPPSPNPYFEWAFIQITSTARKSPKSFYSSVDTHTHIQTEIVSHPFFRPAITENAITFRLARVNRSLGGGGGTSQPIKLHRRENDRDPL